MLARDLESQDTCGTGGRRLVLYFGIESRNGNFGRAGNLVGLYEFYITVPPGLANGDYQVNVTQDGTPTQTMYLTVHN